MVDFHHAEVVAVTVVAKRAAGATALSQDAVESRCLDGCFGMGFGVLLGQVAGDGVDDGAALARGTAEKSSVGGEHIAHRVGRTAEVAG